MTFKSLEVNRRMNHKWFFNLIYIDRDGYKVTYNREGLKNREEAMMIADWKRKELETNGRDTEKVLEDR